MSELDLRFVKYGVWSNVDRNSVMGKTITADTKTGAIVVALLALLGSLAMTHLWNIVMFTIHQLRAKGQPADGLFRQQQIILRISPSPGAFLFDWLKLSWSWKGHTKKTWRRSMMHAGLAAFFLAAIVAVSTFSSYVVDGKDLQVLVRSDQCLSLDVDKTIRDDLGVTAVDQYTTSVNARSKTLAQSCWQDNKTLPTECHTFIRPNILLPIEKVSCPFQDACHSGDFGFTLDSGPVDTSAIFGWNLEPRDRIKFRRKMTFGILQSQERQSIVNSSNFPYLSRRPLPEEQTLLGHYGDALGATDEFKNFTFSLGLLKSNMTSDYVVMTRGSYMTEERNTVGLNLVPLSGMLNDDADKVVIFFAPNMVLYQHPVDDPLFSAHKSFADVQSQDNNFTFFMSDWPASAVGMWAQYQFCYPLNNGSEFCTPLSGLPLRASADVFPGANEVQTAGLQLLVDGNLLNSFFEATRVGLAASTLLQDRWIYDKIPNNQWMLEILGWERYIWAQLQTFISDHAVGFAVQTPELRPYMTKNMTEGEKKLCQVQRRMKTGGLVNINVFGLSFIIAFSCVIVLLDFTILKILIFIGRFRRGSPRVNRWIQDGALQLQRRAHEAAGQGAWTQLEESNPVTTTGELLDELPLSSQHTCCVPSHPKEGTLPELIGLSTSSTVVTTVNQQSPTNSVSSGTDASAPNEVLPSHAIAQTGENMHQVEQPPPASTPNTSGGIKTSPRVSG